MKQNVDPFRRGRPRRRWRVRVNRHWVPFGIAASLLAAVAVDLTATNGDTDTAVVRGQSERPSGRRSARDRSNADEAMLAGRAAVIDGDTLEIGGQRVRLFGIDAPEKGEPGGHDAADELRDMVSGREPQCERVDTDRYGRTVALCSVDGRDLSLAMVREGRAVVWCYFLKRLRPDLEPSFRSAEAEARAAKRGMWARPFKAWREWGC